MQNLRLQAFEQLIAQLALQVQARPSANPANWPAHGLPAATMQWLQQLLSNLQVQVPGALPTLQPLQLLAAQPGSPALMQALVNAANGASTGSGLSSAMQTAAALSSTTAAALQTSNATGQMATPGIADERASAGKLPVLQNWWVQQGSLLTPQGERGFSITLQVPSHWAQTMGAAVIGSASAAQSTPQSGFAPTSTGLRMPWPEGSMPPPSGPLALVLQAQGAPASQRTSALLWLDLQTAPHAPASSAALPVTSPAPALAQEMQQVLQNKADPWLLMSAAQAANAFALTRPPLGEHRSHLCTTEGCQYQGRAPCAQPFCTEMNRIWASTRMEPI
ncbi:Fe-S oxidoreductase [Comamonas sp. Y33R10-2]|nr:Fe-S oxidoreductase [Comamonas sp. Y33R10-2]